MSDVLIYCATHNSQKDPFGKLCRIAEFINSVRVGGEEQSYNGTCNLRILEVTDRGKYEEE